MGGDPLFGLLSLYQFVRSQKEKAVQSPQYNHLHALRTSLVTLRSNFIEAVQLGEAVKSEGARQWVRSMAYHVMAWKHRSLQVWGNR